MNGNQFIELVKLCRKAQREYGRTNTVRWMVEAKRLERLVDDEIATYEAAKARVRPEQRSLFPD